jgi:protein-S-isoprenylcysteine O-methyltransferase Ste14
MERQLVVVLYVLLLIGVIVSVDFLFFKREFWERLIVNIGIVLVFIAFYLRFLKTR